MILCIKKCRSCNGSELVDRMDLSALYPSLFTDTKQPPNNWPRVPLKLVECKACGLVQLRHTFSPDAMYRHYWYRSALNATMVSALFDIAEEAAATAQLQDGDTVLDIGCNDGTLLSCYPLQNRRVRRIGVDPSLNVGAAAKEHCDLFINDYFGENPGEDKAKLITAIAMFYDLDDVSAFLESILTWLREDGVFVVQMTDLFSMMSFNAFDNIVHEHLEYWSLEALNTACLGQNLEVFRVSTNLTNGGSLRAYIGHAGKRPVEKSVTEYHRQEQPMIEHGWRSFELNMWRTIAALRSWLTVAQHEHKRVCGLGASTKGNTLLQLLNASAPLIHSIGEVSPDKFGKYTVGTGIPIAREQDVLDLSPDYLLILPWHFKETFRKHLTSRNLVFPMPSPSLNSKLLW